MLKNQIVLIKYFFEYMTMLNIQEKNGEIEFQGTILRMEPDKASVIFPNKTTKIIAKN